MTTIPVPTASPAAAGPSRARRKWWYLVPVLGLLAVAAAAAAYVNRATLFAGGGGPAAFKYYQVAAGEMQVKVHKDGELQSVNNTEIMCLVEGLSTIVQIVKEGATVSAGDVLVQLDSSAIRQKIEDTTLELQRAESDVATAKNAVDITRSQNDATLEAAGVDVELGKLAISQYLDGTFPQDLDAAKSTLKMAKIKLQNKEDDFKQIKDLFAKSFVNLADVKSAELDLETIRADVAKADGALTVLAKYTHPMTLAGKQSYLKQADQKFVRTRVENQNNLSKVEKALETAETAKKILDRRLARMNEQLEFCTIKAPQSGLVVYNNQNNRDSAGSIQEGTQVRERQVLLRLPDTSAMKAVVRINESQVIRLALGQRGVVRVTGLREPVGAAVTRISPVSDSSNRWMSPDTREYPVELTLDWTPPSLKPGIGSQVEVLVDSVPDALAVPLTAIYAAGADAFVFARGPDGQPTPKKVDVGVANETHVRLTGGLAAGDQVVLLQAGQGRELLEKAGITPRADDQPKARPPGGPAGKTGGGKGKRNAAPPAAVDKPAADAIKPTAAPGKPPAGKEAAGATPAAKETASAGT
ncbi:MAG: czcB 2 [Phycisphaerales bacterium]|nr:czcB 2 [Phycisphaerales bacterium]